MSDRHFRLFETRFVRRKPLLVGKARGVPRSGGRRVISGIAPVLRNGLG